MLKNERLHFIDLQHFITIVVDDFDGELAGVGYVGANTG